MKKRFLSVIITLCLIFSCVALPAFATGTFPDVLSPDHDWAAKQIEEMTDLGIIKGYTDGTFKPDKAITKIEAVILFSRVAGYSNNAYSKIADLAYEKYQYLLQELDIESYNSFKREISFLVYKGILEEDEIVAYLENGKYQEAFPRKDAAMFIANFMDAEIEKTYSDQLDFADNSTINHSDAGYIAYVVENGFMNGVQTEDGSVIFDANGALSRAQVCVLLYRIMEKLDMSVEAGVVNSVNPDSGVINLTTSDGITKDYAVPSQAKVLIDGNSAAVSSILSNSDIVIVRYGREIHFVETISPESSKTISGTVQSVVSKDSYTRLSVTLDGTDEVVSYYATSDYKVTTNGVADSISAVKTNDYVVVKLLGTEIVSIDRVTAEATVQGTVQNINLESPITLSVLVKDELTNSENIFSYKLASDVIIRRDGNSVSLREIYAGDKVVLTIKRGVISKLVATSTQGSNSGTITAIKIATQSYLTISSGGVEKEYPIAMEATYNVGGKTATIYDLRLGNVVKLTLSGSTITKIEQSAESETTSKSGVVGEISTSYYYVEITTDSGVTEKVFASKLGNGIGAKVIDGTTGKEMNFKNIKKGDHVIATGAYSNGSFVAVTFVVTPATK